MLTPPSCARVHGHIHKKNHPKRVPGLPNKQNSLLQTAREAVIISVPRCPRWVQQNVTAKTFLKCLYLVLGLAPIGALIQLPVCSHPPTVYYVANSRFPCNFFPRWPLIFLVRRFAKYLAESRYPPSRQIKSPIRYKPKLGAGFRRVVGSRPTSSSFWYKYLKYSPRNWFFMITKWIFHPLDWNWKFFERQCLQKREIAAQWNEVEIGKPRCDPKFDAEWWGLCYVKWQHNKTNTN